MRTLRFSSALGVLLAATRLWAAPILSVQPLAPEVLPGQTFSLSVAISGVTDLYGYQFDLAFNPAILAALSVSEGSFLASGGSTFFLPGSIDNSAGTIAFNADLLQGAIPGVTGDGTLAIFSFEAVGPGTSSVQFVNVIALNSFGEGMVLTPTGAVVTVDSVGSVPEPASDLLAGAGMVGLAIVFAWRRRAGRK